MSCKPVESASFELYLQANPQSPPFAAAAAPPATLSCPFVASSGREGRKEAHY